MIKCNPNKLFFFVDEKKNKVISLGFRYEEEKIE